MPNLDTRQLIPINYEQLLTHELEYLKSVISNELDTQQATKHPILLHRELTRIRLILATRKLNEMEGVLEGVDHANG